MDRKLRVLVLSSWYPTRVNPTLGNFNEKFAEAAALYNDTVAIHVCAEAGLIKNETVSFVKDGVKTHIKYFSKPASENIFSKILKGLRYLYFYNRLYREVLRLYGKPDVVHLNILYPVGMFAYFLKKNYGIPYVISENWTGYLPANKVKQNALVRFVSRLIAANAKVLMPVTENLKQAMQAEKFRGVYTIVPNVTDIRFFYPPENQSSRAQKVILHVSSLKDEHKNISGILRVMRRLMAVRNDFVLHIVGDGDPEPHKAFARELGLLPDAVHFSGTMSPPEVAATMRDSDFFLLFSNYENLPCVIVEAFASGLPVVSTTAGGIAEHLDTTRGIILEPRDEDALFNACVKMLDTCSEYNKQALHEYALNTFSYQSVGQLLTSVYLGPAH